MKTRTSFAMDPSLTRMAAPLVVSFWMRAVVTFVDTVYAAFLGDSAVAAIGLTIPFEFLMIAVWIGLSTGLTSALSRAMGARHGLKVDQYVGKTATLIWIVVPIFVGLGAAMWFTAPRVALASDVADAFRIYGTVLVVGSAFTTFWSIIPDSLVKAHQDTRSTMWAGIWTNIINVTLNTLFLFVFHWGVFGIALSTVIARLGGLVYAISRARFHENARRRSDPAPSPERDPEPYRRILGLAIPSSATFALMAVEGIVINGLLASMKHATEAIASYSIYYRIVLFALQPVIATSVAMLPYAARRFGRGDLAGVRKGLNEATLSIAIYSIVVVGPVMYFSAPWLAERLTESDITRDYTQFALLMVPFACLGGALFLLARPVFEAQGQGRPGLVMAGLRYLVLTLPLAWTGIVVARSLGRPELHGLIIGLLLAATIASIVFYLWLRATLKRSAGRCTPS